MPVEDKIREGDLQFQKKSYPLFLDSKNGLTRSADGSRFTVDLSRAPTHIPKGALNVHTSLVSATVPWEWYNIPKPQSLKVRIIDGQHIYDAPGGTQNQFYTDFTVPITIPNGFYTKQKLADVINNLVQTACLSPSNFEAEGTLDPYLAANQNLTLQRTCVSDLFVFRENAQGRLEMGAMLDTRGRTADNPNNALFPFPEEVKVHSVDPILASVLGWDTSVSTEIHFKHPLTTRGTASAIQKLNDAYWTNAGRDEHLRGARVFRSMPGTEKHSLDTAAFKDSSVTAVDANYFVESLYVEVDYASMGLNSKMERSITLGAIQHQSFSPGEIIQYEPSVPVPVECYDNMTDDSHNILEFRLVNQNRLPVFIGKDVNWSLVVLIEWEQVIDKERILRSRLQTKYH